MDHIKIQEKSLFLKDEFYISDGDILKAGKFLKDNDINVITGSEYLSGQDESIRAFYIRSCPLLSYSLVIDKKSIEKIKELNFKELSPDFPM